MDTNKIITVTGAGGYIGRHVVTALLDKGVSVNAVDLYIDDIDVRANRIPINIFESNDSLYKCLDNPQICLHLAWQDGFNHNANSHMQNLPMHINFIRKLIDGGLKQLTILGTMHEIGYWEGEINENTPTNPISFYGIAKNSLRQVASILAKENNVIFQWLRAFYIIGDDIKNKSIFSKIIKMEQEGKKSFPFTTGENLYDFINIDELANQIALTVIQTKVDGIINCCSGRPKKLKEMVEEFIQTNHLKIKPEFGAFQSRPYDSPGIWGDRSKIAEIMKRN